MIKLRNRRGNYDKFVLKNTLSGEMKKRSMVYSSNLRPLLTEILNAPLRQIAGKGWEIQKGSFNKRYLPSELALPLFFL